MTRSRENVVEKVNNRRSSARLAAVQALYEIDLVDANIDMVLEDILAKRWFASETKAEINKNFIEPDKDWLINLVQGVADEYEKLDSFIRPALSEKWTVDRLETIIRVILRSAVFELINKPNVPANVIINEYLNVAHAFFDGPENKLINGVLDHLARELRPKEL
jgi:N utilization substance protein B|tara:strand:+ start:280 stop:771 length:492 start_codon:yes stop_codon:yes gene_type:complete